MVEVEKSFLQNEGGYRDGLKHQKGRNKGSLHSKDAQSYMTPSLYLCLILNFAIVTPSGLLALIGSFKIVF